MNKKEKIERYPVPENTSRAFMGTVWTLVKAFGIDKISGAVHYLQLVGDEIDRYSFEQKNPVSINQKENSERRSYIAIFKTRFLELADFEYDKAITPVEAKMISQISKYLNDRGFSVDEYLRWMFEDFLPVNEHFCPPSIKWSCCNFAVTRFLYEYKDLMKQRKDQSVVSKLSVDLINRARVCIRMSEPEEVEKIREVVKKFSEGGIILDDMRKIVESYEKVVAQKKAS